MHQGDEDRFAEFVRAHTASLFRTAYLMTGDYQRAEDVLQAALVRVYQHWPRVDTMDQPAGYARKVVVNQSLSWWRKRSSHEAPLKLERRAGVGRPGGRRRRARARVEGRAEPAAAAARGDGAPVLRGHERGPDRRDARDGPRHGQEPQPRGRPPAGRAARRTGGRVGQPVLPAEEATS